LLDAFSWVEALGTQIWSSSDTMFLISHRLRQVLWVGTTNEMQGARRARLKCTTKKRGEGVCSPVLLHACSSTFGTFGTTAPHSTHTRRWTSLLSTATLLFNHPAALFSFSTAVGVLVSSGPCLEPIAFPSRPTVTSIAQVREWRGRSPLPPPLPLEDSAAGGSSPTQRTHQQLRIWR
jgi:hypothetical protein